jgi:hypothetical protein
MSFKQSLLQLLLILLVTSPMAVAKDVPRPRLKPEVPKSEATVEVSAAPIAFPIDFGQWPKAVVARERAACADILKGLAITYETLAPLGRPQGCGAAAPILISAIRGTRIEPPAEATCIFAEQLHGWVTSSLQPSSMTYLGRELVQIDNASAYVCRRRNGASSGKLSEHAKANGFDIARLHFAGDESTNIKGDWSGVGAKVGTSRKSKFLARIRRDACIRFTTVLGPGSDKYHGDHFHVDYAQRKNGYRICK